MKLEELVVASRKTHEHVEIEDTKSVVVEAALPAKHHKGILHVMGIDPNSPEYAEAAADLDRLSRTNPTLYHKIINMD